MFSIFSWKKSRKYRSLSRSCPTIGIISRESTRTYAHASASTHTIRERREIVSYECRAANGEVFYRHGSCPHQITADGAGTASRKRSGGGSSSVSVTAEALPRGEVCRRMAAAGSIGRAGHERDENVSTYDRNLGRDPCRYF